ncbi:MAG: pilus assembly protein TadG-related protein [bacterium]|nr:pilus assembly protein TadG-related protein [bacterium]
MNNKGQALVLFVIILPIILLITILSIDLVRIQIEKNKLSSIADSAIEYLVKDKKDLKTVKIFISNSDSDIEVIELTNDEVILNKNIKTITNTNIKINNIKVHKKGILKDNKLLINEMGN